MENTVIDFLREINIGQLVAIALMFWFFYARLNGKIEQVRTELKQDNAILRAELKQDNAILRAEFKQDHAALRAEFKQDHAALKTEMKYEIGRLCEKVEDIDRRLCRIEGSLATQGHCLFGQREDKKAE